MADLTREQILSSNHIYGDDTPVKVLNPGTEKKLAECGYYVNDPERYGVVEFDDNDNAISLEEKPSDPKSDYAVSGLYFYPNDVVDIAKNQKPSARDELEITDTNKAYLSQKRLKVKKLGRGFAWLDTGTHDSLLEASQFVQILEKRQGFKISCIEEIAYRMNYIDKNDLKNLGKKMKNNPQKRTVCGLPRPPNAAKK